MLEADSPQRVEYEMAAPKVTDLVLYHPVPKDGLAQLQRGGNGTLGGIGEETTFEDVQNLPPNASVIVTNEPLAGIVIAVVTPSLLNLMVFSAYGQPAYLSEVLLVQSGQTPPKDTGYAEYPTTEIKP